MLLQLVCISKYHSKRENKVINLMITDAESCSSLLRRITSKHDSNYYCINCLYLFRIEKKPKSHENLYKIYDYCHIKIPEKFDETRKYNHAIKIQKIYQQQK